MSFVLRVVLPDRPGSLGAVASALGEAGVDILAMDIVERTTGFAVDDIIVDLPPGRQPDSLITSAESIPGVRVESVRPDPGVAGMHREWELVEAIAAEPAKALYSLADMLPKVLRAGWSAIVAVDSAGRVEVIAGGGGTPDMTGVRPDWLPLAGATILDPEASWVPESWIMVGTELAAAPLAGTDLVVLIGRPGGPAVRNSEVARLGHLASLAAAVSGGKH